MRERPWFSCSPREIKEKWNQFKTKRTKDKYRHYKVAAKDSDWLSISEREHLIDILIERLMKK